MPQNTWASLSPAGAGPNPRVVPRNVRQCGLLQLGLGFVPRRWRVRTLVYMIGFWKGGSVRVPAEAPLTSRSTSFGEATASRRGDALAETGGRSASERCFGCAKAGSTPAVSISIRRASRTDAGSLARSLDPERIYCRTSAKAQLEGQLAEKLRFFRKPDLLMVDELGGYLPFRSAVRACFPAPWLVATNRRSC